MPSFTFEYAVAYGKFAFPVDMLRYDRAFPVTESDSLKIERTIRADNDGPLAVIVGRHKSSPPGRFTADRWKSFGWAIREFSTLSEASDYARSLPEDGPSSVKDLLKL